MKLVPLCRYCGTPIRKRVRGVHLLLPGHGITKSGRETTPFSRYIEVDALPKTRDECRKLTNGHVVSVHKNWRVNDGTIDQFGEWDGESYVDPFFCKGECARLLGYAAARNDLAMPAHRQAKERQSKKAKEAA